MTPPVLNCGHCYLTRKKIYGRHFLAIRALGMLYFSTPGAGVVVQLAQVASPNGGKMGGRILYFK